MRLIGFPALAALAAFPLYAADMVSVPPPVLPKVEASDSLKAAAADTSSDTVTYSAARIRYRNDLFSLSDGALLKYKGSTLTADSIVYYQGDGVVEAFGAPLIEDKANPPIQGYRMRYNLATKVGTVYYGSSKRDNQTFNGVEVRRQRDGEIFIARGDFSTCDVKPDPHYYFYARRMIVDPDAKVLSGPIVMNIAEVPVAVLPMMVMPLGKGRRSGLLQPKFGGDQAQGFYITGIGYYWAINEYMDFLASGDLIEGAQGTFDQTDINTTFQWNKRYVWSGMVGGKVYLSEFDPASAGGYVDFRNDLNLTPDGKQTLKGSGRLQSSPTVVDRNALNAQDRLQQTANARLGYRRQFDWSQAVVNADLAQDHNLTQDHVTRSIPNLAFNAGGPVFPVGEEGDPSSADAWYRQWSWNYGNRFNVNQVRQPGFGTERGDTSTYAGFSDRIGISGKYSALGHFNLTPSLNLSQLWSLTERTGDSLQPHRNAWDPDNGVYGEYFVAWNTGATLDTRLYGIAQAADRPWFGKLSAIRHTISPSASFTYAPELDTNTRLFTNPQIGGVAYQAEQRTVGFNLGNDVDLKFSDGDSTGKKAVPYKLLTAGSSLSYNFANKIRPWSDLTSTYSLYFTRNVAFTVTTTHGLYDDLADSSQRDELVSPVLKSWRFGWRKGLALDGGFSTGARLRDSKGLPAGSFESSPWSAALNYGFDFNATRAGTTDGSAVERFFGRSEIFNTTKTHQAYGNLRLNPTSGWHMSYDTEFNFTEGDFSRHVFGFERTLHCWRMEFQWTPTGVTEGWHFLIRIIDLPDVKLETADTRGLRSSR